MSAETTYSAYLEAVGRDLEVAARRQARMLRRRRARLRLAAIAVASIVLLAGSALAGAGILGGPCPGLRPDEPQLVVAGRRVSSGTHRRGIPRSCDLRRRHALSHARA